MINIIKVYDKDVDNQLFTKNNHILNTYLIKHNLKTTLPFDNQLKFNNKLKLISKAS